ncbi:MATE family efflux transporter [Marinomonas mediterranea]|uniref:MATE family efflux transporter n=1 Tax=Marinomonas mediterranea TaxID=119864 RepID=UPI00234BC7B7|nr:MATE family efflux transporter [Marinomonas mediterranea]WCN11578.1 MATE family efflux transporter [Marinomonas mediterranea]
MTNSALNRKIWHLAWPPMLSNITTPLLGLVDTAVVGHLGTATHLGAVAIGASIFSFLFWAFGFLRMGSTGLTAQAFGQKNNDKVQALLVQSVLMGVFIGLVLVVFRSPIIDLAMYLMSPSEEVAPWARLYCEARILSAPAVLAGYALIGWFFGVQYSKGPLWMLLVINVINMVLDYVAVYQFGMASEGVAWATVIAHYLGTLFAFFLAYRKLAQLNLVVKLSSVLDWQRYAALIRVNRYLFVRTVLLLIVMLFFTAQGARLGDDVLAANAVLLIFLTIISNSLDGFAFALEALCGEYYGSKNKTLFKRVIAYSSLWALIAAIGLSAIFWLFGEAIIELLTNVESVQLAAKEYLPWLIALPLLGIWSFMLDGIFIGTTSVKQMQDTMILCVLGVFFPVWFLSQGMGNHGLWLAQASLFVARAVTLLICYRKNMKQEVWF